jgi:hypothetical protein
MRLPSGEAALDAPVRLGLAKTYSRPRNKTRIWEIAAKSRHNPLIVKGLDPPGFKKDSENGYSDDRQREKVPPQQERRDFRL